MDRPEVILAGTAVIRPMQRADLRGLEWDGEYTHYRRVFERAYDEMLLGQRILLVAAADSLIVGQIFIQLDSMEKRYADGSSRAYLYALRVRPAWRGQQLGTRLVQAAESALCARGFDTAVIAVGKENEPARRLYQRLGFRVFMDDPGVWYFVDVNGQPQHIEEPCWVMEKALSAGV